jgi:hypothetical protein
LNVTCRSKLHSMKNLRPTLFSLLSLGLMFIIFSSLSNESENKNIDVVILKLMGKELESAYIINDGKEKKVREGLTGDEALEFYLLEGYKVEGTSVASDAGRFSVVYTLIKN